MTDDELRTFVDEFCSGHLFTSAHLDAAELTDLVCVFMPIGLGALAGWDESDLAQVGVIWERLSAAGPLSINGLPSFTSCRFMHRDDWTRARAAIEAERERRSKINV